MGELTLRIDQQADLAWLMARPRTGLLHDPGTGKTPTVCVYIWWASIDLSIKTVWTMPKSLLSKNRKELLLWSEFTEDEVVIVDGTPEERAEQMASPKGKVFLMGFWRLAEDWLTLAEHHPEINMVVGDEWHMGYMGATSKTTMQLMEMMRYVKRLCLMTGTLIDGRLDTAYTAISLVAPNYYTSHQDFLMQHENLDFTGKRNGWLNHEKVSHILREHFIRRSFASVFGDTDIVTQVEEVEMSPAQEKAYRQFEDQAFLELEGYLMSGENPGTATIRARQILAHPHQVNLPEFVGYDGSGNAIYRDLVRNLIGSNEPTGKDERLMIHLHQHKMRKEPLIIFGALVPEIERTAELCRKQGLRVGVIHGGIPVKQRILADERFQAGELDVICSTWRTAGVGFNWGHVDHIIGLSLDYKDSSVTQGMRRAIRGVRTKPLRMTFMEYAKTVEQKIKFIVEQKSETAFKVDDTTQRVRIRSERPERRSTVKKPGEPSVADFL